MDKNNFSVHDIRILKILKEFGELTRLDLHYKYLEHVDVRNLTGSIRYNRLVVLEDLDYVKVEARQINGKHEFIYKLADSKALDRYIDDI